MLLSHPHCGLRYKRCLTVIISSIAELKMFVLMFVVHITAVSIAKGAAISSNYTYPGDIDGPKLLEIGRKANNTLVKLFGQALTNVQCRTPLCEHWSSWSECRTVSGKYGTKARTKLCGVYEDSCKIPVRNVTETDTQFCELFWCPSHYTYTRYGFCLELNSTTSVTWNDAKIRCYEDGGHLVNIDSAEKAEDIDHTFKMTDKHVWTDGIKSQSGGIWEYETKSENPDFTNWRTGQPDSSTFPVCRHMYNYGGSTRWKWFDSPCTNKYFYMCEL